MLFKEAVSVKDQVVVQLTNKVSCGLPIACKLTEETLALLFTRG